ncbi:hypothetical protein CSV80_12760 [Sporosarcina sp. P12(2017)]|uniref:hypothetical protein n=1 Tax=unclassified Sporosarcina TaxID=2647733 RepID=UPI000C171F2E|nr:MULTISPECIES: hypothetical protein [unclassified Sporosarcina]PIC56224.1 hypothetical protein CSV81_15515 [Sporosarcina sp. P10]PIC60104.1 hypothetical protein CSV80_12760 [Sporosarcina sp. P12(2017)]
MGYILPIPNYQAQQYAERMNNERHNFAYIGRVNPVRLKNEESSYWEDVVADGARRREEQMEQRKNRAPQPLVKKGFIAPNPAQFSPEIADVVGKGRAINTYV